MNKLILVAVAATAASGIAAAPAFAGLSHNPSFSHQLPVRVPSGAQTVKVADEHHRGKPSASATATATASPSRGREAEPGDDRGVDATASPNGQNDAVDNDVNDDNGMNLEPGDDNGHDGQATAQPSAAVTAEPEPEPGDDRGGAASAPVTTPSSGKQAEAGDDRGGASSGSGSGRGSSGHDG